MRLNPETINSLIEAQYHYFESGEVDHAAQVVEMLIQPLYALGRFPELLGLIEKTLGQVEDPDDRFYIYQARALLALGRPDEALSILELVQYEIGQDRELKAAILLDKGTSLRRLGEFSRAGEIIEDYQEAYGIYEDLHKAVESEELKKMFRENQGTCLFGEGNIYQYFLDNPNSAMEQYDHARTIFDEVTSADGIADATKQMGEIYASPQFPGFYSPKLADDALQKALGIYREINYQKGVLETLYQLGRLHRPESDLSLELFGEYLNLARSLGLIREEAVAKRHIAELQLELARRKHEARMEVMPDLVAINTLLQDAIAVLHLFKFDAWSQRTLMNCYYVLGEMWRLAGNDENALENFQRGLNVGNEPIFDSRKQGDIRRRMRLLLRVVQILFQRDRGLEAETMIAAHADDFKQLELPTPSRQQVQELIIRLTKGG